MLPITILIATRDRARHLEATLDSVLGISCPSWANCRLVVLDNGSSDNTREVVEARLGKAIPVEYRLIERRGKSHAMNAAFASIHEGVVLTTDDDVRVPVDWVHQMCAPFRAGTRIAVAGAVHFPSAIESQLKALNLSHLSHWFAHTGPRGPQPDSPFVGANYAVGADALREVGGLDPELGPGARGFFDETLFAWRLLDRGFRILAINEAAVEHHFDVGRLDRLNLLSLARGKGRSHAYVAHHWLHQSVALVRLRLTRARLIERYHLARCRRRPAPTRDALDAVRWTAFLDEFSRLRSLPRKYTRSIPTG